MREATATMISHDGKVSIMRTPWKGTVESWDSTVNSFRKVAREQNLRIVAIRSIDATAAPVPLVKVDRFGTERFRK